jgi:hypothetical protein
MMSITRKRRMAVLIIMVLITLAGAVYEMLQTPKQDYSDSAVKSVATSTGEIRADSPAIEVLGKIAVKGRAPKTGYERKQFSDGWGNTIGCNVRNYILKRDLTGVITQSATDCTVVQGTLQDPYTNKTVMFVKGPDTSDDVQIDHVVALSNAWQTGAQQLTPENRMRFANDPLNLLAVEGKANQQKSDADAATWLPPNKDYRCRYVARQIAVKHKYVLWVTQAEHDAMARVLAACPGQLLPVENANALSAS